MTDNKIMKQVIADKTFDKDGTFTITGDTFNHLRKVRRVKVGDMLAIRDVTGALYNTTICSISETKKTLKAAICTIDGSYNKVDPLTEISGGADDTSTTENSHFSGCNGEVRVVVDYYLFQCITKADTFEDITKKATECGVLNITPVVSCYTQSKNISALENPNRVARLNKIIKNAREQSGSPVLTQVTPSINISDIDAYIKNINTGATYLPRPVTQNNKDAAQIPQPFNTSDTLQSAKSPLIIKIVLWEKGDNTIDVRQLLKVIQDKVSPTAVKTSKENSIDATTHNKISKIICAILIGSEGGLSKKEIDTLIATGFYALHLNTNILRADTAAIYTIGVVQSIFDMA